MSRAESLAPAAFGRKPVPEPKLVWDQVGIAARSAAGAGALLRASIYVFMSCSHPSANPSADICSRTDAEHVFYLVGAL